MHYMYGVKQQRNHAMTSTAAQKRSLNMYAVYSVRDMSTNGYMYFCGVLRPVRSARRPSLGDVAYHCARLLTVAYRCGWGGTQSVEDDSLVGHPTIAVLARCRRRHQQSRTALRISSITARPTFRFLCCRSPDLARRRFNGCLQYFYAR